MRRIIVFVILLQSCLGARMLWAQSPADRSGEYLHRGVQTAADLLMPGRKQLREGARVRGTLFAGLGFVGVVSLTAAQWTYARKTELANAFEADYRAGVGGLWPLRDFVDQEGFVTDWGLYRRWQSTHASAQNVADLRTVMFWSVAGLYALNAVDVIVGRSGKEKVRALPMLESGAGGMTSGIRLQIEM